MPRITLYIIAVDFLTAAAVTAATFAIVTAFGALITAARRLIGA